MPDHYRTLVQSLMQIGFLFRRIGERKQEVWRNRLTDQEVVFDRREVAGSPTAVAKVLKQAKTAKPGQKPEEPAVAARPVRSGARANAKASRPAARKAPGRKAKAASPTRRKAKAKAKSRRGSR